MTFSIRPISDWTPFGQGNYKNSPFRATYSDAIQLLERELEYLNATDVAVELDVTEAQIKNDGHLRASARPGCPAVRLAFQSSQGPLIYATDEFDKASWRRAGMQAGWQHNLYAIALGLEALRKLDRYGITRRGEQYAGWKALPGGTPMPAAQTMSVDAAYQVLERVIGRAINREFSDNDILRKYLREARRETHPDFGHPREQWDQVEQAALALGIL